MTSAFIHHLESSMVEVFGMMLGASVGESAQVAGRLTLRGKCVGASIPLAGSLSGRVALRMSVATAEPLASALAGQEVRSGTPDFDDALGEIANMVVGGAKSRLGRGDVSIGTPTVAPKVDWPGETTRTAMGFDTPFGKVFIEAALREGAASGARAAA